MSQQDFNRLGSALMAWATAKGMKPYMWEGDRKAGREEIRLTLSTRFDSDPRVPTVDFLVWKCTHPGSVTGFQNQTWNGKPSTQVRGGWVDFICPVKVEAA